MIVDVHLTDFGSMGWQMSCKCHCLQSSLQILLDSECHTAYHLQALQAANCSIIIGKFAIKLGGGANYKN